MRAENEEEALALFEAGKGDFFHFASRDVERAEPDGGFYDVELLTVDDLDG